MSASYGELKPHGRSTPQSKKGATRTSDPDPPHNKERPQTTPLQYPVSGIHHFVFAGSLMGLPWDTRGRSLKTVGDP